MVPCTISPFKMAHREWGAVSNDPRSTHYAFLAIYNTRASSRDTLVTNLNSASSIVLFFQFTYEVSQDDIGTR